MIENQCPRCLKHVKHYFYSDELNYCKECKVFISYPQVYRWDFDNQLSLFWFPLKEKCIIDRFFHDYGDTQYVIDLPYLPYDITLEQLKLYLTFN